jgi:hypothetical protein
MDINKIEVITEWLESKSFKDIQIFLDFAKFYRRFIKDYFRIAAPLISMLKDNINDKKADPFEFTKKERAAFKLLKASFIRALMLIYFKSDKSIKVETNILDFAITEILS